MATIIVQIAVMIFIALVGLYVLGALCLIIALEDIPLFLKIIFVPILVIAIAAIVVMDIDLIKIIF
jgi:hypothetical protein